MRARKFTVRATGREPADVLPDTKSYLAFEAAAEAVLTDDENVACIEVHYAKGTFVRLYRDRDEALG